MPVIDWITTSERQPDEHTRVLLVVGGAVLAGWFWKGNFTLIACGNHCHDSHWRPEVVPFWMLMPEAPEADYTQMMQFSLAALLNEGPEGTIFTPEAIAGMKGQTVPLVDRRGPEPRVIGTATIVDSDGRGIAQITDPSIRFDPADGKRIEDKGD